MKSRFEIFDFPVFGGHFIHVEVAKDIRKAAAKYPTAKDLVAEMDEETFAVTVTDTSKNMSFIFFPPSATPGDIAHEAWHAIRQMMIHKGVELDSETVAYHLGYLVDKIFKLMRRRK